MNSPTLKLQTFLAHHNIASRRKAEEMIKNGQVMVNGQVAHIGQRIDEKKDQVTVNGKSVGGQDKSSLIYFLVYKPRGVVTTTKDELGRKTVLDLIEAQKSRLYPVGRLDQDSEGLMLLTNDGDLTQRLTHPSFGFTKTYHVTPDRPLSSLAYEHLKRGVKLKDGWVKNISVKKVEGGNEGELAVTLGEGKNHEVRRIFRRLGYEVVKLVRVQFGPFTLDDLAGKEWVELSSKEVLV